jgi:hypothetical protein
MGFPQLGNIDKRIYNTIQDKRSSNVRASEVMPWIRVTSCLGDFLTLETAPPSDSFAARYGNTQKSGRIGINSNGESVYADEDSRGLRPSPTIDNVSISQGNEGLSKKSSFTITCYTLGQCETIMEYFCEPANMVLVEWGENKEIAVTQQASINMCTIASYNSLKTIQTKRKAANGMYDAVLGVITGGGMSYGSNETYEVQVALTSVGELPAYLQHHKGITDSKKKKNKSSDKFEGSSVTSEKNIGKRLFKQMYNDLPAHKRTEKIKNLLSVPFATNSTNFVNMDSEIRDDLVDSTKDVKLITKGGDVNITSDLPLFSEKRYIKVALAFTILDLTDNYKLDPVPLPCGGTSNTINAKVEWKNTICRAHKNMFSADADYLYIPNKYTPSFDLLGAIKSEPGYIGNPLPKLDTQFITETGKAVDTHPRAYGDDIMGSYFPNMNALDFSDAAEYDSSYAKVTAEVGEWGYLRDLYINFDFFCDVLDKKGLVTKDVYYDLLNGLASAVNLYWDFQILPRGQTSIHEMNGDNKGSDSSYYTYQSIIEGDCFAGSEELQIVDMGFGGRVSNTGSSVGLAKFQSRGALTPFLSAELSFDIPGAMKGQVIGQSMANDTSAGDDEENPNSETKEISTKGLFTTKVDSVMRELRAVKKEGDRALAEAQAADAPEEEESSGEGDSVEEQQRKANYETFVRSALIVPKEQDRNAKYDVANEKLDIWKYNETTVEDLAVVGAWNDTTVLKKVQMLNEGLLGIGTNTISQLNVPLLPIKFNFTIHGVSGIRVGDTFSIIDLPTKYKTKVFQVTQVEHDIAQNIWTTKIEGSMRNMDAGSGELGIYN